ncbi:hypothetical protein ACC756_17130 [Rhizobium ruizarguesonis]
MESRGVWTAKDARSNFVRLLEQARTIGPQEIHDDTGIYVLKVYDDKTKEDAAKFLLDQRPKG